MNPTTTAVTFDPRWLSGDGTDGTAINSDVPCVFCAIVNGEAQAHVIAETEETLCFLDRLPATYGHALVVPKQHSRDLFDIPDTTFEAVMSTAKGVAEAMRTVYTASGINLVHASGASAHQTEWHFHVHVVPRYDGDSIVVFPRLADPAHRAEAAARLRAALGDPALPDEPIERIE